ncbi:elongation factor G [Tautonia plasticadhaerens]|uniref:Elongation factor G n=1 Tax=Tautonia plasticadhaerens TaxID=2527974 RepID=A0A518GZ97_9BACT|nr:elongation factor G [Tautonia plasticadhaerens]QDV33901.1 Elongation factor G [Tautonia plasticadhaerens]
MATVNYHISDIRNIALAGHGASAKTSLADALLFAAGLAPRRGSVDEGTSLLDVDDEEKKRHFSIDSHLMHLEWDGKQIHLIDSPGYPDFIGSALGALSAVENVLITVSAPVGIEVNTRRVFLEAGRLGLGRFVALTKMDADNVDYLTDLESIRETFGPECVPFNVPIGVGADFKGVVDVLNPPDEVPEGCPLSPNDAARMVIEQIVEEDEELTNRYLEGESIALDELRKAAHDGILRGHIVPVVCLCSRNDIGVKELLDLLSCCGLSPADIHRFGLPAVPGAVESNGKPAAPGGESEAEEEPAEEIEIDPKEDGDLVAQVFKTSMDPFMGKLSFMRIISGKLTPDTPLVNLRTGKANKPGHLYVVQGKQNEEVTEAIAGDIVAVAKFEDLHISDTVTNGGTHSAPHVVLKPINFPTPMVPRAVEPKAREDEAKIALSLAKIAEEDPTFTYRRDEQTHELVINGMSDLHLDVILHRLKNRYKLDVDTHIPHVPYLETIQGPSEADYRHKKQTGGRGQFAEVHLRIRPLERGQGFNFVDAVKGGTIPNNFIPAVEKGCREQMERGIISGNRVVDVEVEVHFGKYHDVDSSEAAFKMASAAALRKAFEKAYPALLEPVVAMEITVPGEKFGDVTADLSTRRGHIVGMDAMPGGLQVVKATVPLAEVLSYSSTLKSMTSGQGSYALEFHSYQPVPAHVQQQIVDRYQKSRAGIEEE